MKTTVSLYKLLRLHHNAWFSNSFNRLWGRHRANNYCFFSFKVITFHTNSYRHRVAEGGSGACSRLLSVGCCAKLAAKVLGSSALQFYLVAYVVYPVTGRSGCCAALVAHPTCLRWCCRKSWALQHNKRWAGRWTTLGARRRQPPPPGNAHSKSERTLMKWEFCFAFIKLQFLGLTQ